MHLEVLVEDLSGKKALEHLLPRILPAEHTYRIISYKGIGRIPRNMKDPRDASKRILLENLPKLLQGYGRAFAGQSGYESAVVVVCDLDTRNREEFQSELNAVLQACHPRPMTHFCLAIEEGEAWLLGDIPAVLAAYPKAKKDVLASYINDSICDTWEKLADAVHPGGARALSQRGWQAVGAEKYQWAAQICPRMDVEENASPSFRAFRERLRGVGG